MGQSEHVEPHQQLPTPCGIVSAGESIENTAPKFSFKKVKRSPNTVCGMRYGENAEQHQRIPTPISIP